MLQVYMPASLVAALLLATPGGQMELQQLEQAVLWLKDQIAERGGVTRHCRGDSSTQMVHRALRALGSLVVVEGTTVRTNNLTSDTRIHSLELAQCRCRTGSRFTVSLAQ